MAMYHIMAVNVDPGGGDAVAGGGIRHVGPGNAFIEARVELATAFTAEWWLQGRGYGIDGRLEVLHKGKVVIAMDAPKGSDGGATGAPIETRAALFPGSYVVLLYGVYDAAAEEAARDGTVEPISIRFKEPKYCNLTEWSTLPQGALDCFVPHLSAKVDPNKSLPGNSTYEDTIPEEEIEVDEETGDTFRKNPQYDGMYMDLHMGPLEPTFDPAKFFNFHFKMKGTFNLFGFIIVIDVNIAAGSAEEGGGITFYFKFEWLMPGSNEQLALIAGNFDLIPLDFAALVTFDIGALTDTKLMLGLIIRFGDTINKMVAVIEPSVKMSIQIIMQPVTRFIEAALAILNALISALEYALKVYRRVIGVVLNQLKAFFAMAMAKINAAQRGVDRLQIQANQIRNKLRSEERICTEPCYPVIRWCCSWRKCFWGRCVSFKGFPYVAFVNSGCMGRLVRRIQACLMVVLLWVTWAVIMALKRVALILLEIVRVFMKAVMWAILVILKIPEAYMMAAMEGLRFHAMTISIYIKPFAQVKAFQPCIGCISFDATCFWRNFQKIKLLRIHEIAVAMEFSSRTVSFAGHFHLVVLGDELDLLISFSLSFQALLEFFKNFLIGVFKELMTTITNAFSCGNAAKSWSDDVDSETEAIQTHAEDMEMDLSAASAAMLGATPKARADQNAAVGVSLGLGGARRQTKWLELSAAHRPPSAAAIVQHTTASVISEFRDGPHAALWHPRQAQLGSSGSGAAGFAFVGTSGGEYDLVTVGRGALSRRVELELDRHVELASHVGALLARWPAYAAARLAEAVGVERGKGYPALLGNVKEKTGGGEERKSTTVVPDLGTSGVRRFTEAHASLEREDVALHSALKALLPSFGDGIEAAAAATPEVFGACLPAADGPLRAAADALRRHINPKVLHKSDASSLFQPQDGGRGAATNDASAADTLASLLGIPRALIDSLHERDPNAAAEAVRAAVAVAKDPCAVAGSVAALQCGALKAGHSHWGETFTDCVHALDIISSRKCGGGGSGSVMDAAAEAADTATATDPDRDNYGLSQEDATSISDFLGDDHPTARATPLSTSVDGAKCVSAVIFHALPCHERCGNALMGVTRACGGLVPRAGRWRHDAPSIAAAICGRSVVDAHEACKSSGRACQSILEASPLRDSAFLATRPRRFAHEHNTYRAKMGQASEPPPSPPPDLLEWNDQHVWGVVPPELCLDTSLEADVRGNNLLGRPPRCMWEDAKRGGSVLVSRNRFAGVVGPLADGVVAVHAGFNTMEGDVTDVFGPAAARGLTQLMANDNEFTSREGLAGLAATGASKLVDLDLSNNRLGPEGSVDLANHLAAFPALLHYDVGGNRFDVAVAAAAAAAAAPFATVHAQVTLSSPSAMRQVCGACPNFEHDIGAGKHLTHAAVMQCVRTNGCSDYAPGIPIISALECALHAALDPILVADVTERRATAADEALEVDDEGDEADGDQESFHSALSAASGWRLTFVEAVQQHSAEGDGFVIGYTLTPVTPTGYSSDDADAPEDPAASSVVDRINTALGRLQHQPQGHLAPAAGHCTGARADGVHDGADESTANTNAATASLLESALLDIRGGCPTGRMGPRCNYLCSAEWHRTARPAAALDGHSIISGADLGDAHPTLGLRGTLDSPHPPRETVQSAAGHHRSRALITSRSRNAPLDADAEVGAVVSKASSGQDEYQCDRHDAARGHCHHMDHVDPIYRHDWVGEAHEERLTMSTELEQCTSACRGHANKAVAACQLWMVDKTRMKYHRECRLSLRDMTKMCGLHDLGDYSVACPAHESKKFSRSTDPGRNHDSGCEVCGVVHYLEQHGLSDDDHEGITGSSSNSKFRKHVRVALEDTEHGRLGTAARDGAGNHDLAEPAWLATHRTRGSYVEGVSEAHQRALLGRGATARSWLGVRTHSLPMAAENNPDPFMNTDLVRGHEAFERDDTHEQSHMFPVCSAHQGCSHPCYTHVERIVMRRCMRWLHAGGVAARTACVESIAQVPQACAAKEITMCAEPVIASFKALLL